MATTKAMAVLEGIDRAMRELNEAWKPFPTSFTGLDGKHKDVTRKAADLVVDLASVQAYLPDEVTARRKRR